MRKIVGVSELNLRQPYFIPECSTHWTRPASGAAVFASLLDAPVGHRWPNEPGLRPLPGLLHRVQPAQSTGHPGRRRLTHRLSRISNSRLSNSRLPRCRLPGFFVSKLVVQMSHCVSVDCYTLIVVSKSV